jgi:hypothetical protein
MCGKAGELVDELWAIYRCSNAERLRNREADLDAVMDALCPVLGLSPDGYPPATVAREAAREIRRLRADMDELESQLNFLANWSDRKKTDLRDEIRRQSEEIRKLRSENG